MLSVCQELNAQGSSRFTRTGSNPQKVAGECIHPIVKFEYSGILPLILEGSYAEQSIRWFHNYSFTAFWVVPSTTSLKKGMNRCHANFKNLNPDHQEGLYEY